MDPKIPNKQPPGSFAFVLVGHGIEVALPKQYQQSSASRRDLAKYGVAY
jgi:hypothetical protein